MLTRNAKDQNLHNDAFCPAFDNHSGQRCKFDPLRPLRVFASA
jgi:hypothetical protein